MGLPAGIPVILVVGLVVHLPVGPQQPTFCYAMWVLHSIIDGSFFVVASDNSFGSSMGSVDNHTVLCKEGEAKLVLAVLE